MVRKKIEKYPGAIYHITTRGNHRTNIFNDTEDRQTYLYMLRETLKQCGGMLDCYCLMTNHTHLMIETGEIIISQIMRTLNLSYVKYFNNKYTLTGHLFQARYSANIIKDEEYKLEASKYIHLNPVRAKIVAMPEEYKWSSYAMFIGLKQEKLVTTDKILSCFIGDRRLLYKQYVEKDIKKSI